MPKNNNKRLEKTVKQQAFLTKVNELKHEIFDQFSPTITKESKKRAWCLIRDYAVSIGLVTQDKDYTYVRDATWPNLRNRTMIKIDKSKKTGEGGGSESKLDDCDKLVLEIIGKESPVIQGIGVSDSLEHYEDTNYLHNENEDEVMNADKHIEVGEHKITDEYVPKPMDEHKIKDEHVPKPMKKTAGDVMQSKGYIKKRVVVRRSEDTKTLEDLKKKKLELEIRKLELDVWEKEKLLKVAHCAATDNVVEITSTNDEVRHKLILDENGQIIILNEK